MFLKNKKTRALILVMSVLFIIVIIFSQWYYKNVNASVDPRIKPARELYKKYNTYAQVNHFDSLFYLMDTIESIYASIDHYAASYEIGVLHNNRAAAYLTIGIYDSTLVQIERDSIIQLGELAARNSIAIYEDWKRRFENLTEEEIIALLASDFNVSDISDTEKEQEKFLNTRVKELIGAQVEINRRLSVSYTNLGIVYRHRMQYDSAAICYKEALDLWERNLSAENNLNLLLGRPQIKRNFIQRMFPPERL